SRRWGMQEASRVGGGTREVAWRNSAAVVRWSGQEQRDRLVLKPGGLQAYRISADRVSPYLCTFLQRFSG
ncbi:unnamed protein product, partial [Gadus morhua 'NCC']